MKTRYVLFLVIAVIVCSIGRSAAANNGLVVVRGNAPEPRRAVVRAAIETATRSAGWLLPPTPLAKKDTEGVFACSDSKAPASCAAALTGGAANRHLFVVGVQNGQADSGAPQIVITAKLIIAESQTVIVRQRYCEQCADDKLAQASTGLAEQILRDLAVRSGSTVASIKSIPDGAQVTLDGEPIGGTDASYGTYPGKHVVVLRKDGYEPETREFTVDEGKTAEVVITLRPAGTGVPPATRDQAPSRLIPALTIGGGALLLSFSSYALYRSISDDTNYTYRRAKVAAGVSGVIGIGAVGTGLYLLWRGSTTSAPTMSVTPHGGAIVGWSLVY